MAFASTPTPTTDDQVLRLLAESTELKLIRFNLIGILPYSWQDAGGDVQQQWNEEAPFRDMDGDETIAVRARLLEQIEQAYKMLSGEDSVGDDIQLRVFDGTPTKVAPAPLDSVRRFTTRNAAED